MGIEGLGHQPISLYSESKAKGKNFEDKYTAEDLSGKLNDLGFYKKNNVQHEVSTAQDLIDITGQIEAEKTLLGLGKSKYNIKSMKVLADGRIKLELETPLSKKPDLPKLKSKYFSTKVVEGDKKNNMYVFLSVKDVNQKN